MSHVFLDAGQEVLHPYAIVARREQQMPGRILWIILLFIKPSPGRMAIFLVMTGKRIVDNLLLELIQAI
jgi:hypothetical protein